jgi:hypothetical protein
MRSFIARTLSDIIRMIESRRMRCAGHIAQMGRTGLHTGHWWEARRKETTRKTKVYVDVLRWISEK